jgi:hypothetical protein
VKTYLAEFFLDRNISDKRCREMFSNVFLKIVPLKRYCGKKMAAPDRPHMAIRRMSFAYRMTKAVNTLGDLYMICARRCT